MGYTGCGVDLSTGFSGAACQAADISVNGMGRISGIINDATKKRFKIEPGLFAVPIVS